MYVVNLAGELKVQESDPLSWRPRPEQRPLPTEHAQGISGVLYL